MNQTNATLKCTLSAFLLVWMSTLQDAHSQGTSSLSLDGAFSGLWFNPDFNGQGFQFQIFGDETNPQLFAIWYTHLDAEPTWLFGIGPATSNPTTLQMAQVIGGEFPPDFEAGATTQQAWGSLTIERTDDASARVTWSNNDDPAIAGNMALTRLTQVSSVTSRSCLSGSWFNVSQSGHGWLSEVIESNGQAELVATWYAHINGQPTWVLAQGPFDGRVAEVQAIQTSGSQFPPDFDPDDVQISPWGAMRFEFINDDQALVSWQPTDTRFSNGILTAQRLTAVSGIECETDRTLNSTAEQLNTFYAPYGGRDAFPEHYVKSIETFLAAQDDIEQDDLTAASTRIQALFQEQPLSTGIWFDQATLNDLNVGSPIAYYGLRMMETIVNPPPQTRSGTLNFTALVASCASVERPTLPSLTPETVDLAVHPDILANDARVLHQSTDLFRRWLTAITGGMDINFSVVETTECTTVDFQVGDGIIVSYPDSNGMVESLPQELIDQTDIWWVVAPSGVPGDGSDFEQVFITGGMGLYRNGAPLILSDDGWFVRKPAHLGSGPYSEVERRLYLPQWFQHEFMHHLYRTWPEFELEKTSHSWFNRFNWPNDFVGQFEPDYYSESLNKRLLTATPSLGEGLSLPDFLILTASNLDLIEGRYTRLPIENDFHDVTVTIEDGVITWANLALSWELIIDEGRLFSEAGSPYGVEPVLVELNNDGTVAALIFLGERYERAEG